VLVGREAEEADGLRWLGRDDEMQLPLARRRDDDQQEGGQPGRG
jgi:hypothetical protein